MTRLEAGGTRAPVTRTLYAILPLVLGIAVGCSCSKTKPKVDLGGGRALTPKDALRPGNTPEARVPFRCAEVERGAQFALGPSLGTEGDDDSGVDVPFGINVGQAIGYEGGFAVTAIDGRGGKSVAVLALLGADSQNGRKLDLGRVYGDADPPRLAGDGRSLVIALTDMDAAGRTIRLLRVEEVATLAKITRGSDISVPQNLSTAYSLAVNAGRGVLAWDEPERTTENSQIALASFSVQTLALPPKPLIISARNADAEASQVILRPGGFWVAWVQSDPVVANTAQSKKALAAARKESGKASPFDTLSLPALELGARNLYVSALDSDGHPTGKPLRASEGLSHVVTYDMATLDDGSAVLAWRDDDASPGVEAQLIRLGRVGLDGHVEQYRIEDDSIGVGAPQFLFDTTVADSDRAWLAVGNTGDKVSLTRLLPNGKPSGIFVGDADLGVANPLVRFGGRLLVSRQRGKGVDLEPLRCKFSEP